MTLLYRLLALVAGAVLVASTLPGCAGGPALTTALSQTLDTTVQQQLAHQLSAHRVKIKGPLTIQVGNGNVNAPKAKAPVAAGTSQAQDYTRAGQHGGALATAPGASAGATTRTGVPSWVLVAGSVGGLLLVLLLGLVYYGRRRLLAPS